MEQHTLAAIISPGLENFLYVALGSLLTAVVGGIGYLVKRKVEKKPTLEDLEVSERAMKLLKEITTQNLTIEEFHIRREQILNPSKSLGRQEQRVLLDVTQLQLTQLISEAADTGWIESLRWQSRVEDRLYKRTNQEEAVMFATSMKQARVSSTLLPFRHESDIANHDVPPAAHEIAPLV